MHHEQRCSCWGKMLLGAALGVALGLFINSEKGRQMREKAKEKMHEMKEKMKGMRESGQEKFEDFMENAAKEYSKTKGLSDEDSEELLRRAKKAWQGVKKGFEE